MKKQIKLILISFILMVLVVPMFFFVNYNNKILAASFDVWDGTVYSADDLIDIITDTGTGESKSEAFLISSAKELASLDNLFQENSSYLSKYYRLANNIDLDNRPFHPIGYINSNTKLIFSGTFDGSFHTIKNLKFKYDATNKIEMVGLFCCVSGKITNLCIDNVSYSIESGTSISKITFGSICSNLEQYGEISNCKVNGQITATCQPSSLSDSCYFGGITGKSNEDSIIENCTNEVNFNVITNAHNVYIGGIAGNTYRGNVINCINKGNYSTSNVEFKSGNDSKKCIYGGIVGDIIANVNISQCANYGNININISNRFYYYQFLVGGIVGFVEDGTISSVINNCYNIGNVSYYYLNLNDSSDLSKSIIYGGIVGQLGGQRSDLVSSSDIENKIKNSFNYGYIEKVDGSGEGSNLGSLVGRNNSKSIINSCFTLTDDNFVSTKVNTNITMNNVDSLTNEQFKTESVFADYGYDFINTWQYTDTEPNFPTLRLIGYRDLQYYTITFIVKETEETIDEFSVVEGGLISTTHSDLEVEGYDLVGWKNEADDSTWDFESDVVLEDTTLYADLSPKEYVLTLYANGGSFNNSQSVLTFSNVAYNSDISGLVFNPSRETYAFVGWTEDEENEGDLYTLSKMPIGNLTLYAKWTKKTVKVNVNSYYEINDGIGGTYTLNSNASNNLLFGTSTTDCNNTSLVDLELIVGDTLKLYANYSNLIGYNLFGACENNLFKEGIINSTIDSGFYTIQIPIPTNIESYSINLLFKVNRYKVILSSSDNNLITSITPQKQEYMYNEQVNIVALILDNKQGLKFNRWVNTSDSTNISTDENITYNSNITFNITKNIDYTAICAYQVKIDNDYNKYGKAKILVGTGNYDEYWFENGEVANIKVTSIDTGFKFNGWSNSDYSGAEISITINSNPIYLTPYFVSKKVIVKILTDDENLLDISNSTNTVNSSGEYIEYEIGYKIDLSAVIKEEYRNIFKFSKWETTNIHNTFNDKVASQTYIITNSDVLEDELIFKACVIREKVKVNIEIAKGEGIFNINDNINRSNDYECLMEYNSNLNLNFMSSSYYRFDKIIAKKDYDENYIDLTDLVIQNYIEINCDENINIKLYYEPVYWTEFATTLNGSGTKKDPYLISNVEEFAFVALAVNLGKVNDSGLRYNEAHYLITQDIDFSNRFWTPIGEYHQNTDDYAFNGVLDRNYKNLTNIKTYGNVDATYFGGLFGYVGKNGKVIHETDRTWFYVGVGCSVVFSLALTGILVITIIYKKKRKKKKNIIIPKNLDLFLK